MEVMYHTSGGFRRNFGKRQIHLTTCTECGIQIEIPFKPLEGHQVLCRDCFRKQKKYPKTEEEDNYSFPPDFEFIGIVGPDGNPINDKDELPRIISLAECEIDDRLINYLKADPKRFYELPDRKFELLVAEVLARYGFQVDVTHATRDGGVDIYAAKNELFGRFLYLIECKRYSPPQKVGIMPVRSLYGVVQEKRATAGVIATTSYFTNDAKAFQATLSNHLKLCDYVELQKWLANL
jgi:restriction system protein